jgi:type III secretion system FlhB-like substrate exporter
MADSQLSNFLNYLHTHPQLASSAKGKTAAEIVAMAKENGFDVSVQEMQDFMDSYGKSTGEPVVSLAAWNAPI